MSVKIISVGKPIGADYRPLVNEYEKRLVKPYDLQWLFVAPSGQDLQTARRVESAAIASKLSERDYVVLLDERGRELTSEALAAQLDGWVTSPRQLIIVIGGAYGVDEALRERADFVWSLSPLVFPHEIVRLIAVEQLYRAQAILAGHPYHHT